MFEVNKDVRGIEIRFWRVAPLDLSVFEQPAT